eukprot:3214885-Amphidinium_carterae.1
MLFIGQLLFSHRVTGDMHFPRPGFSIILGGSRVRSTADWLKLIWGVEDVCSTMWAETCSCSTLHPMLEEPVLAPDQLQPCGPLVTWAREAVSATRLDMNEDLARFARQCAGGDFIDPCCVSVVPSCWYVEDAARERLL